MRPHASRRIAAVLSCAGICARLRCDAPQHEGTPARARNLTTLCRHADGCPRSMLREELGPINSGLCAALAIIATCGFHGTLACALTSSRRARPSRARASSRIGRTTPSHRRLLQLEGLQQEISTVRKSIERSRRPVCGVAGRPVAIASGRNPFARAHHVAGTNGLLGIGRIYRTAFVEAPCPGRTGRTFQSFLALLPLLERELGIYGANPVGVRARLDGVASDAGQTRAVFDIA